MTLLFIQFSYSIFFFFCPHAPHISNRNVLAYLDNCICVDFPLPFTNLFIDAGSLQFLTADPESIEQLRTIEALCSVCICRNNKRVVLFSERSWNQCELFSMIEISYEILNISREVWNWSNVLRLVLGTNSGLVLEVCACFWIHSWK